MSVQMKPLASFNDRFKDKRSFVVYSLLGMGIPLSVILIWLFGSDADFLYWIFLASLAFAGAYVWSLGMWRFFTGGSSSNSQD